MLIEQIEVKDTGKVIGNIYCGDREFNAKEVGLKREAHFKQNIFFHRDSDGNPIWKDTYVYAALKSRE